MAQQHSPAMKVGGRRLSLSARHKPAHAPILPAAAPRAVDDSVVDYPRPTYPPAVVQGAMGQEQADMMGDSIHGHGHGHDKHEDLPKKEKKTHPSHGNTKKEKEALQRPTREPDMPRAGGYGAGGRIGQPTGKILV
ncbi:hypothetical protein CYLTODRAFT_422206 [Cylindrobasidium torrendii FP15055 ss-10]|uniref:Uncharacterized protein n=1 Tax=Cylindrobasidium torrendii FP15055 ss-10 TaxID=1314674 RepID=A0A0D7BCE9_9AGAR|nr:hypothetical protein CYLTODRAFT_422206 [Cylindrobasidium torrendii FP15055 ss-10]